VLNVVGRHIEIVNATAQLLFLCKVSHMKDSEDSKKGILIAEDRRIRSVICLMREFFLSTKTRDGGHFWKY
jgi:hypothetical protein